MPVKKKNTKKATKKKSTKEKIVFYYLFSLFTFNSWYLPHSHFHHIRHRFHTRYNPFDRGVLSF